MTTDWRSLALWLADCTAATAEYDGMLKSTSKARRQRLGRICEMAYKALSTGDAGFTARDEIVVLKRLHRAGERCGTDGE